jgi:hypothetical protein
MQPTPPGESPGLAPAGTTTAANWAGYAATGTKFSSVSAGWVVPTVTCITGKQLSAAWVGLDGFNSATVEQIGTDSDCAAGAPNYYAWYELFPSAVFILAKPVAPGDRMSASVVATTPTTFALTITDVTKGWTRAFAKTLATAKRSSAEIIQEAPCCTAGGNVLPLANFGTINFTNANANGQPIGNLTPKRINMVAAGVVKATTSALTLNRNFSVTWNHR